jgi:secondary thiamine-phosphate synthase enzyme
VETRVKSESFGRAAKYRPAPTAVTATAVKVETGSFEVSSEGEDDVLDLTSRVREAVSRSGLSDGVATVFVAGSTAAVTTMEFEPGLVKDFPAMLERAAPSKGVEYEHQRRWHDGNGHSHVKASLVGPSVSIPFVDGDLVLGEWQQVVLLEFDVRPRKRKVLVQLIGSGP